MVAKTVTLARVHLPARSCLSMQGSTVLGGMMLHTAPCDSHAPEGSRQAKNLEGAEGAGSGSVAGRWCPVGPDRLTVRFSSLTAGDRFFRIRAEGHFRKSFRHKRMRH